MALALSAKPNIVTVKWTPILTNSFRIKGLFNKIAVANLATKPLIRRPKKDMGPNRDAVERGSHIQESKTTIKEKLH